MIWCLVRKGQYRIHLVPRLFYTALSFSHFTTYKTSLYYFFQCDVSISIEMSTASMPMVLSLDGFVKTTLSDLGYADYSEYFIGYSVSTYWRKKDSKADIFLKSNPYELLSLVDKTMAAHKNPPVASVGMIAAIFCVLGSMCKS